MKVLVTGAAGFFGTHIVRQLIERGEQVRAMVHSYEKVTERLNGLGEHIEFVISDVKDRNALTNVMDGVDAVIHLVAVPMEKGEKTYEGINHWGTVNVVDAAVEAGIERFIHLSHYEANPKSFSPFVRSKGEGNVAVEASPLQWTMIHPSLTFGPYDRVFNSLVRMIRLTPFVFPNFGGGKTEFQPVSVYDVVDATVQCLYDDSTIHQHYNFGGPEVLTLNTIMQRVMHAIDVKRLLLPIPLALLRPPTFVMHHLLPQPPASVALLNLLAIPNVVLHNNDFERFNITPRPFAGENLDYLKAVSSGDAVKTFLGMKPV